MKEKVLKILNLAKLDWEETIEKCKNDIIPDYQYITGLCGYMEAKQSLGFFTDSISIEIKQAIYKHVEYYFYKDDFGYDILNTKEDNLKSLELRVELIDLLIIDFR